MSLAGRFEERLEEDDKEEVLSRLVLTVEPLPSSAFGPPWMTTNFCGVAAAGAAGWEVTFMTALLGRAGAAGVDARAWDMMTNFWFPPVGVEGREESGLGVKDV